MVECVSKGAWVRVGRAFWALKGSVDGKLGDAVYVERGEMRNRPYKSG